MTTTVSPLDGVADWVHRTRFEDIPAAVIKRAKIHLKDGIGVAIAAANEPALSQTIQQFAPDANQPTGSRVAPCSLVSGQRVHSPAQTALINGMAAHYFDFDDTSFLGIVHGTAVIWPSALAMAQYSGSTGKDLLLAFILASEALYYLGDCLSNDHYRKGWWSSATLGIFGATVAAAKATDLNQEQTRNALRLASTHAFGVRSVFGAAAKPFLLGRTAQAGVDCAQFGMANLSAPEHTFEGSSGFVDTFNGGQFNSSLLPSLGKQYRLIDPGVAIKLYPVCSAAQAGTEAVMDLIETHDISVDDITKIEMRVTDLVATQLRYSHAVSVAEAQFCLPFTVASIVLRNKLGIDELSEAYVISEPIQSLMSKVEMIADNSILNQTNDPEAAPESAHAFIHLNSGQVLDLYNPMATGMPGKTIPDADLDQKFISCVERTRGSQQVSTLKEQLNNLETLPDLNKIF